MSAVELFVTIFENFWFFPKLLYPLSLSLRTPQLQFGYLQYIRTTYAPERDGGKLWVTGIVGLYWSCSKVGTHELYFAARAS